MRIIETAISDVVCFEPRVHADARGFFMETWRKSWFDDLGIHAEFVQENHSQSVKGVLRGLHYQLVKPQGKLVRVIRGEVFDVAVDLRRASTSFGSWVGVHLSADNKRSMWIPPGFAHGFLVLSAETEFVYKCTDYYAPEHDRTLLWNDPALGIDWPLDDIRAPTLSDKDLRGALLSAADVY
ncbi:MAG: dTDP-4-dehydrorhamnose 3,5-epimerase [Spongiibacteraceae bacterium]|jgi:dTDP-4-dehydrorhamnose 3,5-epimerase|nr:dTDP-4-dehydrorhamnose 3,5-epimerase [Spongiibacteraceae bacterium]